MKESILIVVLISPIVVVSIFFSIPSIAANQRPGKQSGTCAEFGVILGFINAVICVMQLSWPGILRTGLIRLKYLLIVGARAANKRHNSSSEARITRVWGRE